jgi:hypothetical protein
MELMTRCSGPWLIVLLGDAIGFRPSSDFPGILEGWIVDLEQGRIIQEHPNMRRVETGAATPWTQPIEMM